MPRRASRCPGVHALVFLGFPLHPPKQPGVSRAEHLAGVHVPMLFLQGTRDDLADLALVTGVCRDLGPRATLHVVDGANHAFEVLKRSGRTNEEVREETGSDHRGMVPRAPWDSRRRISDQSGAVGVPDHLSLEGHPPPPTAERVGQDRIAGKEHRHQVAGDAPPVPHVGPGAGRSGAHLGSRPEGRRPPRCPSPTLRRRSPRRSPGLRTDWRSAAPPRVTTVIVAATTPPSPAAAGTVPSPKSSSYARSAWQETRTRTAGIASLCSAPACRTRGTPCRPDSSTTLELLLQETLGRDKLKMSPRRRRCQQVRRIAGPSRPTLASPLPQISATKT